MGAELGPHPEIVKLEVMNWRYWRVSAISSVALPASKPRCWIYEEQPLMSITEFLMHNGFGLIDLRVFGVRFIRAALQANAFFVRQELQLENLG
jgi:hypothetical protein